MKTKAFFVCLINLVFCVLAHGKIITLTASSTLTNQLVVASNEVALLTFYSPSMASQFRHDTVPPRLENPESGITLMISNLTFPVKCKDMPLANSYFYKTSANIGGFSADLRIVDYSSAFPLRVAGPAIITLTSPNGAPTMATFEVTTSDPQFVPSSSVVIPADSGGPVNIILESSVDLVNWIPANPGTYGTTTTNRFFRVRAQRQ